MKALCLFALIVSFAGCSESKQKPPPPVQPIQELTEEEWEQKCIEHNKTLVEKGLTKTVQLPAGEKTPEDFLDSFLEQSEINRHTHLGRANQAYQAFRERKIMWETAEHTIQEWLELGAKKYGYKFNVTERFILSVEFPAP